MNTMFGEWYRAAQMEPKSPELELRWQGVEKLKASSDNAFAEQLVRLHLGLSGVNADFLAEFRKTFFDIDGSFRMASNNIELQVLAGAVLASILERKDIYSDGVALIFVAASSPELRKKFLLKDVMTSAVNHLFDRGTTVRDVATKTKINLASLDAVIEEMKTAAASNPATLGKPLESAFKSIAENFLKLSQNIEGRINNLQRRQDIISEEANIVWWLFAGANRKTLKAFSEEDAIIAAFGAAKDLADLTLILPPPIAGPAYLTRCLTSHASSSFPLQSLASAASFSSDLHSTGLFPLTSFLSAVALGKPAKEAGASITKTFALLGGAFPIDAIAKQFYRELLAHRFLAKAA